jgi:arylsulfatase A-like enzyme
MKRWLAAIPIVLALILTPSATGSAGTPPPANAAAPARPNIVFILMDDFSLELLRTMPQARKMTAEGASYDNAFVVDSLCCPSRTSLLTGQTPHQTGVLTNTPRDPDRPIGGYAAFAYNHTGLRTFNRHLQASGYRTGFIGKFLNGYEVRKRDGKVVPPRRLPGWTDLQVIFGGGYGEWGFWSSYVEDGQFKVRHHPKPSLSTSVARRDRHYATNVMARKAVGFIREHRDDAAPYFLEIATYGPHASLKPAYRDDPRYPPAFRDRPSAARPGGNCGAVACSALTLKDLKGYDDPRGDNAPTFLRSGATLAAPAWRTNSITLTDKAARKSFRDRARMVQSIDRLVARVRREVGPNTYVVLTADNGFRTGQHQLNGGKGTPYDSDTRVPLVVVGPGVTPGPRSQFVNNIDLASTFEDLAGLETPAFRSGRSFAPSLVLPEATGNRYALFEHTYGRIQPGEVDMDKGSGGTIDIIPSYVAVRGERGLLVRFDLDNSWRGTRYAWELYRYDRPWEDRNVFAEDHDKPWALDLRRRLLLFEGCTPAECREAAR